MALAGHASRSRWALALCAGLIGAVGCRSTQATSQGIGGSGFTDGTTTRGDAIAQGGDAIAQAVECGPTDSTVSCCLKQHPGEYERCGAMGPKQAPKQAPKQTPETGPDVAPPLTDLSPEETREREQKCREYWNQCIALGGEHEKRGQHGQTVCRSCYQTCKATGSWPDKVNDFVCLGGY